MRSWIVLFVIFTLFSSPTSFAEEEIPTSGTEVANDHTFDTFKQSPWVGKDPYVEMSANKLGFGLTNFLLGWTSLLYEPYRYDNKLTGLAKGSWRMVTNTFGGALHAVTFFIPVDIPLPDGGVHWDLD